MSTKFYSKVGFVSTRRSGFHMTFENGLTASVQWGAGSYSDNHFHLPARGHNMWDEDAKSSTAEVAVIGRNGELMNLEPFMPLGYDGEDIVAGYLTPYEVLMFMNRVQEWEENK